MIINPNIFDKDVNIGADFLGGDPKSVLKICR